jgi:hypothetical protein
MGRRGGMNPDDDLIKLLKQSADNLYRDKKNV